MKNVRKDFLAKLPAWAQARVNKSKDDIHGHFDGFVNFVFEDGSHAFFNDAFYFFSPDGKEVAILTEHCGYHVFAYYEGDEVIDKKGSQWFVDGTRVSGNMLPTF